MFWDFFKEDIELKMIYIYIYYESWVVPAGVPSALADIGGGVEANY